MRIQITTKHHVYYLEPGKYEDWHKIKEPIFSLDILVGKKYKNISLGGYNNVYLFFTESVLIGYELVVCHQQDNGSSVCLVFDSDGNYITKYINNYESKLFKPVLRLDSCTESKSRSSQLFMRNRFETKI